MTTLDMFQDVNGTLEVKNLSGSVESRHASEVPALTCEPSATNRKQVANGSCAPSVQNHFNHVIDPPPAFKAAQRLKPSLSKLQSLVLQAFQVHGPMTDEELEMLPEFNSYGPSTIRKRRSELFHLGKLCSVGEKVNKRGFLMTVWKSL